MPHVLVAGKLHPSGIALLEAAPGITYDYVEAVSEESYAPLIDRADALVIRTQPLSPSTVARAGKLKIVSRHGVGYDAVALPQLNERGIALAIVGDINSISVAEHAMLLLLAAVKRLVRADLAVRGGDWSWRNQMGARELAGKRLLIIGYGRIGRHLGRMAATFDMEVKAYDPFLEPADQPEGKVSLAKDLHAALAWADMVSINAPKAERPIIGAEELAAMKPTAVLVNTARGSVVDEAALVAALRSGRIAGAGIDVFSDEPPALDNPLLAFDQVILTPHIAGLTAECGERMAVSSVQNVLDFFAGSIDPQLIVNSESLRQPAEPPAGR